MLKSSRSREHNILNWQKSKRRTKNVKVKQGEVNGEFVFDDKSYAEKWDKEHHSVIVDEMPIADKDEDYDEK